MDNKISFREVVLCWWSFFWRFAVTLVPAMILSGYLINLFGRHFKGSGFLFYFSISIGFVLKVLFILLVFRFILGRKIGKSSSVLIPAKSWDSYISGEKIKNRVVFLTSLKYVWRFSVFAFSIAALTMIMVLYFGNKLGYNQLFLLKQTKLVGNLTVIPATFIAFVLMLWRSKKRRTLDIIKLEPEVK